MQKNSIYSLAKINAIIRDFGWKSSKKENPTYSKFNQEIFITEFDFIIANNIYNLFLNLNTTNKFLLKIKEILNINLLNEEHIKYLCCIVKIYDSLEFDLDKYIGEINSKVILDLTFQKQFNIQTKFGIKYINIFTDSDGNNFVWNTMKFYPFKFNKKYLTKATIKAHNLYKGKYKQTEIIRCKFTEN